MEHAVVHLAGKLGMDPREFLPEPDDVAAVKQQMKAACALRNKKKVSFYVFRRANYSHVSWRHS